MSVRKLELATAPRDVPGLCQFSTYMLLKFAEEIGMLPTPDTDVAFQRLSRAERAEQISAALKAYDAKNGGAPAPAAPAPPAPAAPAAPAAPTAPGGAPAPAVTGRTPRNNSKAAAKPPAPAEPAPGDATAGLLAALKDELETVKANGEGVGKNVLDLSKQLEALTGLVNQLFWMVSQVGEATIGAPANEFADDSAKATGKG